MSDILEGVHKLTSHLCDEFDEKQTYLSEDGAVSSGLAILAISQFFSFTAAKIIHLSDMGEETGRRAIKDIIKIMSKDIFTHLYEFKKLDESKKYQ